MLDDLVNNIITSLDDNGLYENTVFVFSSDNGGMLSAQVGNYPYKGNLIAPSFEIKFSTMLYMIPSIQRINKSSLISDNANRF